MSCYARDMISRTLHCRLFALFVAAVAWAGLGLQIVASIAETGSLSAAAWVMVRFFTVLTNLAVAVTMAAIALGRLREGTPRLLAGLTLAILLVGVVYALLLAGTLQLQGTALIADRVMHYAVPLLMPLFWLLCVPKGGLRFIDPLIWAIYPSLYLLYAVARGALDSKYPYPFIDVPQIGWPQTVLNVAVIALGFIAGGCGLVLLDRWLGRGN